MHTALKANQSRNGKNRKIILPMLGKWIDNSLNRIMAAEIEEDFSNRQAYTTI